MTVPLRDVLTKALIEKGFLKEQDLQKALKIQKEQGGNLRNILAEYNFVKKEDLISVLSRELKIPPINLTRFKIDPKVIKLIPKQHAQHYNVLPVSKVEDVLTIAMDDPLNIFALDHLAALTKLKITPLLASKKEIQEAIYEYYEGSVYEEIEEVVRDIHTPELEFVDDMGQEQVDTANIMKSVRDAPVIKLEGQLLSEAVKLKASDILIEPLEDRTRIRYRIDGILKQFQVFPKHLHSAVVSRFKVISNLNIAEQRLPQDGRFKMKIAHKEVDFRISVLPSSQGEKVALRVLDKSAAVLDIRKLGFSKKAIKDFSDIADKPHGMVLICGPTGCGKTTTLYAILSLISTPEKNIVTVEDPIEFQIEGLNQVSAKPEMGLTFASALRSILRQDPDVIMIGEIRDYDTADISIKAALTGHLLLTTLHTTTATGSLIRLVNMGVEPFMISSSVILAASQRLARMVCSECKEPYELDDVMKKRLGIKEKGKVVMFRGRGCTNCMNTGSRGRTAIAETCVMTHGIRQLIAEKADEGRIRERARKEGMISLREDGLEKARHGIISLEEVLRVTASEQEIGSDSEGN